MRASRVAAMTLRSVFERRCSSRSVAAKAARLDPIVALRFE